MNNAPKNTQSAEQLLNSMQSAKAQCPRCHGIIETTDCYCRHCAKPLQSRIGFWYDHGGIFLLTLLAGPFALFTLWLSRKLSITAKLLWSAGIGLLSAYLIYAFYQSYLMMKEALDLMLSGGM